MIILTLCIRNASVYLGNKKIKSRNKNKTEDTRMNESIGKLIDSGNYKNNALKNTEHAPYSSWYYRRLRQNKQKLLKR